MYFRIFPRVSFLGLISILLSLFSFPSLSHASITPSLSPSRTTGVAPLSVFFDASSTTSTATSLPFHEIDYAWNFGDDDTLTWDYGTRPGVNKKNRAYGPEAAHVFEPTSFPDDCSGTPCKTYTVTLTIFDGTDTETTTQVITVTDPDAVYADADTICIAAATTPVAGSDGCPGGASVAQQSDWATIVSTYVATGKRILLRHDNTFTTATAPSITVTGPGTIGMYGSGAKPILQATADISGALIRLSSPSTPGIGDWRFMDLEFDANGHSTSALSPNGGINQVTYLRLYSHVTSYSFLWHSSIIDYWNNNGSPGHAIYDQIAMVDCRTFGGYTSFVEGKRLMIMGNDFNNNLEGEHTIRAQYANGAVISNNTLQGQAPTKSALTIRASHYGAANSVATASNNGVSENIVVSGNKLVGNAGDNWTVYYGPQGAIYDERINNIITERNWFVAGSGTAQLGVLQAANHTIRNNIFDNTAGGDPIKISSNPSYVPATWSHDVSVYNNTMYSGRSTASFDAISIDGGSSSVTLKNNIAYAPGISYDAFYRCNGSRSCAGMTGFVGLNNSTDTNSTDQIKTTNPFPVSTPSILADFIPTTGSYALASGTSVPVYRDFYNNLRGGTMDMGAFKEDSDPNDITPPTITSVTSDKANGTYITGEVIDIDVTFSEAVTSTGNVTITLETGTTDRTCTFTVSNSTTGTCNYTVQTGDTTSDLTTSSISGTITDQSNNAMVNFTPATTLGTNKALIIDATPPTLSESSPISTSTDTTPDYTFTTTEAGTITYGGDCSSSTTTASSGSNTITLNTLSVGTHANCTITVTDSLSNASTPLAITSFTITEEAATPSSEASSDSSEKKPKKKKISGNIIYKKGERIPPYITLQSPRIDAKTTASFRIQATAKDRSGIQAMFVSINGLKKKRMNTNSILYTAKKRKNSSITVTAYDTLGNVKVAQITVTDGKVGRVRYY